MSLAFPSPSDAHRDGTAVELLTPVPTVDHAVSWGAILAGGFATAALCLILLALGAGAGLSSLGLFSTTGITPSAVGVAALAWVAFLQLVSGALGGYITGRLRTHWRGVHIDEVHFRDSAHGLLSWCVSLVGTAAFLTGAGTSLAGHAIANNDNASRDANRYYVDRLFRAPNAATIMDPAVANEANIILMHTMADTALTPDDQGYLASAVSARTGMNAADASARVTSIVTEERRVLDQARKATAHALYWLFVSLLLGAFVASWFAIIGGRQRDRAVLAT